MSQVPLSTDDVEELTLLMLRESGRGDAVSLYQDETGATRAEARRAVEKIAQRHGLGSRVWPSVALAVAALVGGLFLLARL